MSAAHLATATWLPQVSFKKILVPTDFSACSQAALQVAANIARAHAGEIVLAHVIAPEPPLPTPMEPPVWEYEHLRQRAKQEMNFIARAEFLAGVPCAHEVHVGDLWPTLVFVGEKHAADLIVAGTHGRTGLKKLVRGSVAETIFRLASVPVITVGPGIKRELLGQRGFLRVLFATDFSATANHALPYAAAIAGQERAHLLLLHVLEGPPAVAQDLERQVVARAQRELWELIAADVLPGAHAKPVVVRGPAPEGILDQAEKHNADLIVMGVRQATEVGATARAHLPWATAHQVVRDAKCPVMTVRS